jgi:YegS/Rv2252/BmrU family lipid kinase
VFRPFARLDAFDRRLFERLTRQERQVADVALKRLSNAANRSLLWLAIAMMLALFGGRRGRRGALRGIVAITITSTLVNLPLKYLARRDRPPRRRGDRPLLISVPGSFSFPSGHSASAFAFATAASLEEPRALPALLPLAAGVAYSRVHLRVHYPLDVLAGTAIGGGIGLASGPIVRASRRSWNALGPVPTDRQPQTNQLILIASPHAGHEDRLRRARRAMTSYGLTVVDELTVQDLDRLPRILQAHRDQPPIVVAAGGDGTVGAVADAVVGTTAVLGILPLGTSNDFARSIDVPMHVESAVRLLSRGPVSQVDAGRFNGNGTRPRHFVHAAAAGLNVQFARFATRADLRERLGRLTYAVAAALALRERPVFSCSIEHEGQTEQLSLVHLSVINAPVFGGFLDLKLPGAAADDRLLNVIMVEHLPMRRLLRSALYPAIGLHRRVHGIRAMAVSRLSVQPPHPMDVTLDGEIFGQIPGTFEVVPLALRVIAPFEMHGNR